MRELSMAELEAETVAELPERNLMKHHRRLVVTRVVFVNTCHHHGFNTFGFNHGFNNGFSNGFNHGFNNGFGGTNAFAFNGSGANAASQNAFVGGFQIGHNNSFGPVDIDQSINQSNNIHNFAFGG